MVSKFVIYVFLINFAYAYGRDISNARINNEVVSTEKEGRIIDIPLIGGLFYLACQVIGVIISKAFTLLEYKLAALSFVSNWVSWFLKKPFLIIIIIAAVAVLGLCAVTGFFSAEPVYEIEQLVRTVRSLDGGVVKYVL